MPTITFNANGGTFPGGSTTNTYSFTKTGGELVGYSHTSNVSDTGLKNSNYGTSWTNSNIRGTGRTSSSSNAHVLTSSNASDTLDVYLYYNGESIYYDWVSVFSGQYSSYTAYSYLSTGSVTQANNYVEGVTFSQNKFGGYQTGSYTVNGNLLTNVGYTRLSIPSNSVTFAFKSNSSGYGRGYGYYAIVKTHETIEVIEGEILTPSKQAGEGYVYSFKCWNTSSDGTGTDIYDPNEITSDQTLFAIYKSFYISLNPFYIESDSSNIYATTVSLMKWGNPVLGDAIYRLSTSDNWLSYTYGTSLTLNPSEKCYFAVEAPPSSSTFSSSNHLAVNSGSKYNVGGNLSCLIGGSSSVPAYYFSNLFGSSNSSMLISAQDLDFSSITTLSDHCYYGMFTNCSNLITAPTILPAMTLASYCYSNMFYYCTSLTVVPELPTTTLANYCYSYMFSGCTSLTEAPELSATTLANYCYNYMFSSCTSLTEPPELPATTLANSCYESMFRGCKSLRLLPSLPATTLVNNCYSYMFYGCSNINLNSSQNNEYSIPFRIPSSGEGSTVSGATLNMFTNVGESPADTPDINTTYYLLNLRSLIRSSSFYIEALDDNISISLSKVGSPTTGSVSYTFNTNNTPIDYNYGDSIQLTKGQKCYFRRTAGGTFTTSSYVKFASTGKFNVGGDLFSLNFYKANTVSSMFCRMFSSCNTLISASSLNFSRITGPELRCFENMFEDCTSLVHAPTSLNITTLSNYCYTSMFKNCTSLEVAPELPATTLSSGCYSCMFDGCISLTQAPELPATTLAGECYDYMFKGCTSLTAAPELPATTLANYCYRGMFSGCTSLEIAPELPATTLANYCYSYMFYNCTSLVEAPEALRATVLSDSCYNYMFLNCSSLIVAPKISATTVVNQSCYAMFQDCTSLKAAPELPATTLDYSCYGHMFDGCTSLVEAPEELPAITLADSCYTYMFSGCTSLETAPELPATTLAGNCYYHMFDGCTSLVEASELSATTLASYCYSGMFTGCTSLVEAPELPATTLEYSCYSNMFDGCISLTQVPELSATTLARNCYSYMFNGCISLENLPNLPATSILSTCYRRMFYGTNVRLSDKEAGLYTNVFRIPSSGEGSISTDSSDSLYDMFGMTLGDITGTPELNKTYYYYVFKDKKININYNGDLIYSGSDSSITLDTANTLSNNDLNIEFNPGKGFINTSYTTANAEDVTSGKYLYDSTGVLVEGSLQVGDDMYF